MENVKRDYKLEIKMYGKFRPSHKNYTELEAINRRSYLIEAAKEAGRAIPEIKITKYFN